MSLNSCPCCSTSMLLHLSSRRSYWLCPHCRLEMPNTAPPSLSQNKTVSFNSAPLKTVTIPTASPEPVPAA